MNTNVYTIKWCGDGLAAGGASEVQLLNSAGTSLGVIYRTSGIASCSSSGNSYSWNTAIVGGNTIIPGSYRIRVQYKNSAGTVLASDVSDSTFNIVW